MTEASKRARSWYQSKWLTAMIYALIGAIFAWTLTNAQWDIIDLSDANYTIIVVAAVLGLTFRFACVAAWVQLLHRLKAKDLPHIGTLAGVYATSWIARYIPGTIPAFASRVHFARMHGVSGSKLAVSTIIEAASQVIAALAGGTCLLLIAAPNERLPPHIAAVATAGLLILLLAMVPAVFNYFVGLVARRMGSRQAPRTTWRMNGLALASYGGAGLLSGLSDGLLVVGMSQAMDVDLVLYLAGASMVAGAIGMLTPFVPSGLGTKDATLLLLLLPVTDNGIATLVVVSLRLWSLTLDVVFWLTASIMRRIVVLTDIKRELRQ